MNIPPIIEVGDVPERVAALYEAIDDPDFQLCYDASNFIQCGCDSWKAYLAQRDRTGYYHMKDCTDGVEVPLGSGQGHIRDILFDLAKRGYDGFLTLEPHTFKYALMKIPVYLLPPVGKLKERLPRDAVGEIARADLNGERRKALFEAFRKCGKALFAAPREKQRLAAFREQVYERAAQSAACARYEGILHTRPHYSAIPLRDAYFSLR